MALLSGLTVSCSPLRIIDLVSPRDGYQVYGDLAYGAADRQRLDVYVPDQAAAPLPIVVFFYGGRWQRGDKREYRFVAQALAERGVLVVVPDYRLYPDVVFPAFIEDGARAILTAIPLTFYALLAVPAARRWWTTRHQTAPVVGGV